MSKVGNNKKKIRVGSLILRILMIMAAILTAVSLFFVLGYILIKGIPYLSSPGLFSMKYNSDNVSLMPALINTIILTGLSLLVSIPFGVGAAIYLVEYAKQNKWFVKLVRLMSETLSGIPSIIYGLFGMIFFVVFLNWGYSMVSGIATISIMVLPTIMRTTEEALLSVPDSFREGSYALGSGKLRTIFKVVMPTAIPGILSGIILAIGRIVGETAALLYTSGSSTSGLKHGLLSSGRTLSVHMYVISGEGLHTNQTYATAVILLALVFLINALSSFVAKMMVKKQGN